MSSANKEIRLSILDSHKKDIHSCLDRIPLILEGIIKRKGFTIKNTIEGLRITFDSESKQRHQWKMELKKRRQDKKILKLGRHFFEK